MAKKTRKLPRKPENTPSWDLSHFRGWSIKESTRRIVAETWSNRFNVSDMPLTETDYDRLIGNPWRTLVRAEEVLHDLLDEPEAFRNFIKEFRSGLYHPADVDRNLPPEADAKPKKNRKRHQRNRKPKEAKKAA